MAINQISFFVLPEYCLSDIAVNISSGLDGEIFFDDEVIWNKYQKHYSMFNLINEILPLSVSWSKSIILFGEENSNRLEVYFNENEIISSVSFRIDFTSNYEIILIKLLAFFKSNNLVVVDEKLDVVELELNFFVENIRNTKFNGSQLL